jgi:hypothetical protein
LKEKHLHASTLLCSDQDTWTKGVRDAACQVPLYNLSSANASIFPNSPINEVAGNAQNGGEQNTNTKNPQLAAVLPHARTKNDGNLEDFVIPWSLALLLKMKTTLPATSALGIHSHTRQP